ncbi:hypothetical protein STAS_05825 [Striga asiatica]|uniref:Uncharacterized protein n=1 Tax=Striga asiatica TaxID=4170 RepID=A0A5A7PBL2_STRAF|nr:hypothetical protein STAS_05825 [Striga asiatica]
MRLSWSSHESRHARWNTCRQANVRTSSPSRSRSRHTTQSRSSPDSGRYRWDPARFCVSLLQSPAIRARPDLTASQGEARVRRRSGSMAWRKARSSSSSSSNSR